MRLDEVESEKEENTDHLPLRILCWVVTLTLYMQEDVSWGDRKMSFGYVK